jgi:hypothetical protein
MKNEKRIRVEVAREELDQAIVNLEAAKRREQEARWKLNDALDVMEKGADSNA